MRKTNDFFEENEHSGKTTVLMAFLVMVTLLLTGAIFASKTNTDADDAVDLRTTDVYEAELEQGE